ncbi:hypothetical protein M2326_001226 [Flavobacterium sp. 7A]|nr:hypothetical protein [Flavobacterium sp. 7A]
MPDLILLRGNHKLALERHKHQSKVIDTSGDHDLCPLLSL